MLETGAHVILAYYSLVETIIIIELNMHEDKLA